MVYADMASTAFYLSDSRQVDNHYKDFQAHLPVPAAHHRDRL
jgi:hypothetical protein